MNKQMKRKRLQILNQYPALENTNELKMFFTAEGMLSDVTKVPREDTELGDREQLYSDSDSEDDLESADYDEFKNLNESSMDRMKTL